MEVLQYTSIGDRILEAFLRKKIVYISIIILLILSIMYLLILNKPIIMWVLKLLKEIGVPFFLALIFAYLLHPLVNLLVRVGLKRKYAVISIFLVFFLGISALIFFGTPILIKQIQEFTEQLPVMFQTFETWYEHFRSQQEQFPVGIQRGIESGMLQIESMIENWTSNTVSDIGDGITSFMKVVTVATLVPFIVFYMLKDLEGFHQRVMKIFPKGQRRKLDQAIREINIGLSSYVSGQLLVSLLVGILVIIGYLIIDFPYPLVFGMISMVFNIVPYIGPFLGALPAMVIGITVSWKLMLLTALVNMIVQTVEGNFISPYIVGRSTHLHPLSIIVAVLVGGQIAGIAGLILAVPVLVMLKVIIVRITHQYFLR